MANTFQRHFPDSNSGEDGYITTTPVGSFPANGYGLFDMSGNVWEWTADWYRPDYYKIIAAAGSVAVNPKGAGRKFRSFGARHTKEGSTGWFLLVYGSIFRPLSVGGGKAIRTREPITLASTACSIPSGDATIDQGFDPRKLRLAAPRFNRTARSRCASSAATS
jgi:hypothetical protein